MIFKILMFVFWLGVIPFLVGIFVTGFSRKKSESVISICVYGNITIFAIFQILAIPLIFLKAEFMLLVYVWAIINICLAIVSLISNRERIRRIILKTFTNIPKMPWWSVLIILMILFQTFMLSYNHHGDLDDSFYVATSVTTWKTNSMYVFNAYTGDLYNNYPARYILAPFPVFEAMISQLVFTHPTIVAHTILPVWLVPLAYGVYWLLGQRLFKKDSKKTWMFLFFLAVLHVFGNASVFTVSTFLLVRIWQGKAVLASILLPLLIYQSIRLLYDGEDDPMEWLMLLFTMTSACMVSSMGVILAPIALVCYGAVYAVLKKKYKGLIKILLCCMPNMICGIIFLIIR